jgi:chromate transporter
VTSDGTPRHPGRLRELAALFLRLGVTSFGGPAAHIALMEDELVERRGWLTRASFLDLVAAANLIPGPNSTEVAIHIGRARAGMPGLLVAGSCFILPAMLIVMALAWAYVEFGALPAVSGALYGVKPVILAIVLQAIWRLGRSAVKDATLVVLTVLATAAVLLGAHELLVLLGAGLLAMAARRPVASGLALAVLPFGPPAFGAVTATGYALWPMFLFFLKVGSVLYGSGYVLLAFLRSDLVERWHWLTEAQLLDAIAAGQITPGPVFTTATFIGYLLGGPSAALLATLGIFLPAFVFVALSAPLLPRLRRSPSASAFLDGVNVASLALMAVVAWQLLSSAVVDLPSALLGIAGAVLLLRFRVSSAWLVLGGAACGLAISLLRS